MKRLHKKQLGSRCSWCNDKAVYREDCFNHKKYACESHKQLLAKHEHKQNISEEHLTEADYQTWSKL